MWYCFKRKNTQNNKRPAIIVNLSYKYNKVSFRFTTYEIKNIRINDGYHLVSTSKPLSGIIDSNLNGVNDFCFTIESDKSN